LRGLPVALNSEVGKTFITDCTRNSEGLVTDSEIQAKYELSDPEWQHLSDNAPLLRAIRAERDHRVRSGDASREAAQHHLTRAPNVLNGILTDEQIAPRHRIEAARELRQVAGHGPVAASRAEKIIINIDMGGDNKLHYEGNAVSLAPNAIDDGAEE